MKTTLYGLFTAACFVAPVCAQTSAVEYSLEIKRQPIVDGLIEVSKQTGLQIGYVRDTVKEPVLVGPLAGRYTIDAAMAELLSGSGLSFERLNERTIAVVDRAAKSKSKSGRRGFVSMDNRAAHSPVRLAAASKQGQRARVAGSGDDERLPRGLEEIIVTATKREQRLQDIPISIAVIGTQDIDRRGLIGMEDYLRAVPGVNQIDRGGAENAIVIRGVTTSPQSENFNSGTTVATYFDETPITGSTGFGGGGGIDLRPVDIERIEILRGPQGTAYGSSSLGGAMRTIPVKPKLDGFGAKVVASYSGTSGTGGDNSMVQGVVNIPVIEDKLALRAVGYRYDESGFYKNIAGNDPATIASAERFGQGNFVRGFVQDDVGQMVSTGGRLSALWKPTDKLTLSVHYLTQEVEQDGRPEASTGRYDQARIPTAPQVRVRGEPGEVQDTEFDLLNAGVTYDFGWAQSTTVASWVDSNSVMASQALFVAFPASTFIASDFESFTAETRLASKFDGPFQFLAGVYYEDVDETFLNTTDWPGAPAPSPTFVTNPVSISDRTRHLDQVAVFGELSYEITDQLTATVGGRYFDFEKNEHILRREGGLFGVPLGGTIPQQLNSGRDDSIFKANLSYKPTDDSLLFVSWAEGFRLGRADVGLPSGVCDVNGDGLVDGSSLSIASTRTIDSDYLEQYEIGGKFAAFDRRLTVDTSVYYIQWDGLPIRTLAVCGTGTSQYTANAGAATSTGAEFQASVVVAEGLRFDFGGGYTEAELSEDAPGLNAQDGARLPGSPHLTANLAAQYDFDAFGNSAFVRADSFYTGTFYGNLQESPLTKAGGYTKVDARAGVMLKNLSVELFVRNLTNEDAYTWRGLTNATAFFGYRLRPRTIGIQLGYSFE